MRLTKKNFGILFSASMVLLGLTYSLTQLPKSKNNKVFGEEMPTAEYTISFSPSLNKFSIGNNTSTAVTARGTNIAFEHQGLVSSTNWSKITTGGFIQNVNPINGLKYIRIDYVNNDNAKINVSYGWGSTMDVQTSLVSSQLYSFNNDSPSYVRIDNLSGKDLDITGMEIGFSCSPSSKPNINGTFVSEIRDDKYVIDVKSLTLSNIQGAYNHAINLNESQLEQVNEILINLPSGDINLNSTLVFEGQRQNNTPIRFRGNNTTVNGGDELVKGNWSLYQNDVYRTFIGTNLDKFSNLIVNGESKTLARSKDLDFSYSSSNQTLQFRKTTLDVSSLTGTCQIVTLERWAQCIGVVESFTQSGFIITSFTLNLDTNGQYIYFDTEHSYRPSSVTEIPGYLQDNLFFLDEAGEWFYSKDDGYLYYKPENASTINTDTFIIPKAETLMSTDGLVENVIFDNLVFSGSNYAHPLEVGFMESQTSWYTDPETKESQLISGMIEVSSSNTLFTNCVFKNSGNIGVHVSYNAEEIEFVNDEILNSGAGAFYVGNPLNDGFGEIPQNINIDNNNIDNYGLCYKGGPGICAPYVDGLNILNNDIQNGGYSGIAAGWGWLREQHTCGHGHYRISYNRITNVMNSEFHDGGGIYVLGNFPNQLDELFNEISYNYIGVNYLLNGGIYLDEGSSSWDVHHNVINVTGNNLAQHGVIMMHDPIDVNAGTNVSQFANHITNNYYHGDVDGTENISQLTYENDGGTYYSGTTLTNYNNQRNIIFDTPIQGNDTHVNESIYQTTGRKNNENILFSNSTIFERYISGASNLSLNTNNNEATFEIDVEGFTLTADYIDFLLKQGYSGLSLDITATSLNSTQAVYAVCFSGGSLSWQAFYTQSQLGSSLLIPLNRFDVEGATCIIRIRDINGLSQDNNIPARVTISNIKLSKFSVVKSTAYDDITLLSSENNAVTYYAQNVSYNWKRLLFLGMKDARDKGYKQVRISVKGNSHNLYVFKSAGDSELDYNNRIFAGGGSVLINLENTDRNIAIMTTHERDGSQDESGQYGQYENLTITYKFISSSFEDILSSKKILSHYLGGIVFHGLENNEATISFKNSRMRINHSLIQEMKDKGVTSFEFDLAIPNDSDVKSIVTCWFGGPNNTDVSYNGVGVFRINGSTIHVILYADLFNNAYDIELVSRDLDAYSGVNINLNRTTISNFVFNY